MGTHISRGESGAQAIRVEMLIRCDEQVKSVDLDIWTPDQIEVCSDFYDCNGERAI